MWHLPKLALPAAATGALGAWHALVPPALPVQGKYELRRARERIGSVEAR